MDNSLWSPSMITDRAVWDAEQDAVFAAHWVAVGRSLDLAKAGDHFSTIVAGEPIVVLRDGTGSIRALSNVCRHRGTTLVEGSGHSKTLQCPNHRWTFQLDGTLAAAPSMNDVPGFDKATLCLPAFAVCEWQGWVMVNVNGTAPALDTNLSRLDDLLEGGNLSSMCRVGALTFPSPWNWKISIENFAESYHHQSVHPLTLQPMFPGAQSFLVNSGGQPWTWLDHVSTMPDALPFTANVVFPTLMFSWIRPDAMAWFRVEPLSHCETLLTIELFVQPEDADNQELNDILLASLQQINSEDIDINRRTFLGLQSRHAIAGPLSPLEGAVAQFRAWILAELNQASR